MNIDEIRQIVRNAIWRQIHEIASQADSYPKCFSDFRWNVAKALIEAKASQDIILESYESELGTGDIFDAMYESWMGVQSELKYISNPLVANETWKEIKGFYLQNAVDKILNRS